MADRFQKDELAGPGAVRVIIGMLLIWGSILAIGAILNGSNIWRPVIIMLMLVGFAGLWLWMLGKQKEK